MLCSLQLHRLASGRSQLNSQQRILLLLKGPLVPGVTSSQRTLQDCFPLWFVRGVRESYKAHTPFQLRLLPQLGTLDQRNVPHHTYTPKSLIRKPSGGSQTEAEPPATATALRANCSQRLVSVSHVSTALHNCLTWPELTQVSKLPHPPLGRALGMHGGMHRGMQGAAPQPPLGTAGTSLAAAHWEKHVRAPAPRFPLFGFLQGVSCAAGLRAEQHHRGPRSPSLRYDRSWGRARSL